MPEGVSLKSGFLDVYEHAMNVNVRLLDVLPREL